MSKKQDAPARAPSPEHCVLPEVGGLLTDYIIELLSDKAAEAVREHLLICNHCMEDYRNIMGLRATARKVLAAANSRREPARENGGAVIRHISDYKK